MKEVYIIDACRTAIGRYAGSLSAVRPDDMLATVLKALISRNPSIDPAQIEEVISGAANQAGEDNRNVARMAALLAGLPISVAGVTVNRLCASGLQAVIDASRAIMVGEGDFYLAGGVESMTRAPYVMAKAESAFGRLPETVDSTFGWRFVNPDLAKMYPPIGMGETAENLAVKYKVSREAQDQFAWETQQKWKAAHDAGKWKDEIVPVSIPQRKGDPIIIDTDEHPRPETTLEGLAKLRPAFKANGTVTAGNASGINDGSSAVLLASGDMVKKYNLKPLARIVAHAVAGVDPSIMGIGPVPATQKALQRAGLTTRDLGLIELNEAFAAQSIPCIQDLDLDPSLVNVNGGAIALGHPLGCSGARILTTLVHEMKRRPSVKYGLATLCVGVGQGVAVVVESV
ncbi:MAG: acetyl-CoA C-acyltransferase [Bacteroidia bacterium]|nr:acetyl-CoA C-acyltransferase [Bacteroidia bacterium]